ncbi:catalase [Modestobacter sp. Leaf380]|uniref:catalase n=1 Tax=Modestobacter sp. Leaf380 TaxID=1736356 RepID=UPI0006FC0DD2|nr:catalase [Modestobacter sp. Leaf380]KQS71503.1 catalase [Modestobacter sp. Leaf380]
MTATPQTRVTTDDAGIPAASDEHSLTAGADGPILLSDHYLIQKMAQFNRERVPERVVHAKGGGAFGTFRVTADVSHLTKADFLQPGKVTPMLARFSTVAGEQGFPDTARDPRGFSLKFYTEQGNYDMVGNNTPVFFVRDPSKFQDFIHSQKRRADNGLRDNGMQWDFWTLSPESSHQVTILMSDRGTPRTWRNMNGYSSHTFLWENAAGDKHWVKYHFKTDQGVVNFTDDEAGAMAGEDGDFHRRDLREAIETGDHPSWTFSVQVMPFEDAADHRVNPFDVTKTISQQEYPLVEVGRMTLDRNPENHFAQIEQAAFEPSNLVPGIGYSPDKMLLGRLFSYPDAHRYRIGTNYLQLPVNAPLSPVNSYNRDGAMRFSNPGDPVYAPSTMGGPVADPSVAEPGWHVSGDMQRAAATLHAEDDDTTQPGILIREVMSETDREHLVANILGHAGDPSVSAEMKPRIVEYWRAIDPGIGARVEKGLLG